MVVVMVVRQVLLAPAEVVVVQAAMPVQAALVLAVTLLPR